MKKILNPDAPLMRFLSQAADLVILNLVWLACCLPVVTAGASTAALYRITLNMVRGTGRCGPGAFWAAFRENFRRATGLWLLLLAALSLMAVDLWFCTSFDFPGKSILKGFLLLGALIWLLIQALAFPLAAQFDSPVRAILVNSLVLGFSHLPASLLMILLNALPWLLLAFVPAVFLRVWIFWLILGSSLTAYINTFLLRKIFAPLMPEDMR